MLDTNETINPSVFCKDCGHKFSKPSNLKAHKQSETACLRAQELKAKKTALKENPRDALSCETCGKEFKYESTLNRHVQRGVCNFATHCEVCSAEYMETEDPDEHHCKFVCICGDEIDLSLLLEANEYYQRVPGCVDPYHTGFHKEDGSVDSAAEFAYHRALKCRGCSSRNVCYTFIQMDYKTGIQPCGAQRNRVLRSMEHLWSVGDLSTGRNTCPMPIFLHLLLHNREYPEWLSALIKKHAPKLSVVRRRRGSSLGTSKSTLCIEEHNRLNDESQGNLKRIVYTALYHAFTLDRGANVNSTRCVTDMVKSFTRFIKAPRFNDAVLLDDLRFMNKKVVQKCRYEGMKLLCAIVLEAKKHFDAEHVNRAVSYFEEADAYLASRHMPETDPSQEIGLKRDKWRREHLGFILAKFPHDDPNCEYHKAFRPPKRASKCHCRTMHLNDFYRDEYAMLKQYGFHDQADVASLGEVIHLAKTINEEPSDSFRIPREYLLSVDEDEELRDTYTARLFLSFFKAKHPEYASEDNAQEEEMGGASDYDDEDEDDKVRGTAESKLAGGGRRTALKVHVRFKAEHLPDLQSTKLASGRKVSTHHMKLLSNVYIDYPEKIPYFQLNTMYKSSEMQSEVVFGGNEALLKILAEWSRAGSMFEGLRYWSRVRMFHLKKTRYTNLLTPASEVASSIHTCYSTKVTDEYKYGRYTRALTLPDLQMHYLPTHYKRVKKKRRRKRGLPDSKADCNGHENKKKKMSQSCTALV